MFLKKISSKLMKHSDFGLHRFAAVPQIRQAMWTLRQLGTALILLRTLSMNPLPVSFASRESSPIRDAPQLVIETSPQDAFLRYEVRQI